ncbi:ABC transporter permease [Paenibacillus sp. J2TS4]|uniref:ABC transporter permease n=1 Tax=Paenibacillus sp. J2TS4 TaxID=2807194 RepID=UPI001B12EB92|nr:ABC transporter permease [Paenibacillus sp. J2TS4]GIP36439.1 peptide ABC transporter permease [Paenibacillus sp. J2TS4]
MINRFILGRLVQGVLVLLLVSVVAFFIMDSIPGDPALALYGNQAQKLTPDERERINRTFGMDRPLLERYTQWLSQMMKGDLGKSYREGRDVSVILAERFPNTLLLFSLAMPLIILLSILWGTMGGLRDNSLWDKGLSTAGVFFASIPAFWLGIVGIYIFSVYLGLLPSSGMTSLQGGGGFVDRLKHLILPVTVMTITHTGLYARFLQEKIIEENNRPYVRAARANGMREIYIVRGLIKNAMAPYLHYLGLTIPSFFGGSILIESVFAWPGLGALLAKSAATRDYPLLMGSIMLIGIIVLLSIMVTDLISYYLNPRLRRFGTNDVQ